MTNGFLRVDGRNSRIIDTTIEVAFRCQCFYLSRSIPEYLKVEGNIQEAWLGPGRITPPGCPVQQLPEVDAIVISHCHYDHLDIPTIKSVNEYLFQSLSIPSSNYHCLDSWHNCDVTVHLLAAPSTSECESAISTTPPTISTTFRLHCTPAQHWGNCHLFDRSTTLWGSWAIESNPLNPTTSQPINRPMENKKLWFGSDTGYRSMHNGEDEDALPVHPVFKDIGAKFGGFDLVLNPIGAYAPRSLLSPMHCSPKDIVIVFKDMKAKRALAINWGTWVLSSEGILEPVEELKAECAKAGVDDGKFTVCGLGDRTAV
ncbi:hypothetical protein M422DRAFT_245551 [Sphaerobolus stellatus SS14]|nr:hypothetical protein M422DRAFT_245551 [Sphaerobolus stellatus SS14]